MASRWEYGCINADGSRFSGSNGYQVKHIAQGTYMIDFNPAFASTPAVVLTQNFVAWRSFEYEGGSTCDNAVLVACDASHCKVITGDGAGNRVDRNFVFQAVGA
jgi:hypothetical protein